MYYAQLDNNGKVHTTCELAGEVDAPDMVHIKDYDINLLGKYYNPIEKCFEEITVSADKLTIMADGLDTATVTAKVPAALSKIAFCHADTDRVIATVPVDPVTHTAALQVTATTPGVIKIRAGEQTVGRQNEMEVLAQ